MKRKQKTVCSLLILSLLIVCSCFTSTSYAQSKVLSGEIKEALPDAIDLLIELGQLRRAYSDLQSNYFLYQMEVQKIKAAQSDLIEMKQAEIDFWRKAYDQENKWYKTFWFGLAVGIAATAGTVWAVK